MAVTQFCYDVTFPIKNEDGNYAFSMQAMLVTLQAAAAIGVICWTNVLSLVVLYIVHYSVSFDVLAHFRAISAAIFIPIFIFSVFRYLSYLDGSSANESSGARLRLDWVDYGIRFTLILVNFVACGLILMKVLRITDHTGSNSKGKLGLCRRALASLYSCHCLQTEVGPRTVGTVKKTPKSLYARALRMLAERMIYYPILQFFCRAPRAFYENTYGFGSFDDTVPESQFPFSCIYTIVEPSAGFWYLIVFLILQPNAWLQLKQVLVCNFEPVVSCGDRSDLRVLGTQQACYDDIIDRISVNMPHYDEDDLATVISKCFEDYQSESSFVSSAPFGIASSTDPIRSTVVELFPVSSNMA
jgi:hypothetical protein